MPGKTENVFAVDAVLEALRSAGIAAGLGSSHDIDFMWNDRQWHIDLDAGHPRGGTAR